MGQLGVVLVTYFIDSFIFHLQLQGHLQPPNTSCSSHARCPTVLSCLRALPCSSSRLPALASSYPFQYFSRFTFNFYFIRWRKYKFVENNVMCNNGYHLQCSFSFLSFFFTFGYCGLYRLTYYHRFLLKYVLLFRKLMSTIMLI